MNVAIDTNRLLDLFREDLALARWLGGCEQIFVPLPVLAELRSGFLGGARQSQNEVLLVQFLARSTVQVLLPDRETTVHYARLWVQLRAAGTPIPINDLWIAALATQHELEVVTRDAHFHSIPQLRVIDS